MRERANRLLKTRKTERAAINSPSGIVVNEDPLNQEMDVALDCQACSIIEKGEHDERAKTILKSEGELIREQAMLGMVDEDAL